VASKVVHVPTLSDGGAMRYHHATRPAPSALRVRHRLDTNAAIACRPAFPVSSAS
jgi:hypothetical protein